MFYFFFNTYIYKFVSYESRKKCFFFVTLVINSHIIGRLVCKLHWGEELRMFRWHVWTAHNADFLCCICLDTGVWQYRVIIRVRFEQTQQFSKLHSSTHATVQVSIFFTLSLIRLLNLAFILPFTLVSIYWWTKHR